MSGAATAVIALIALIPLIAGAPPPSPHAQVDGAAITVTLCNGGTITIDVGGGGPEAPRDCHPKGCHAGTCREKSRVRASASNGPNPA